MTSKIKAKTDKEHRIASILAFASQLHKQLRSNILNPSAKTELLQNLSKSFPTPDPSLARESDDLGRSLWNASIQLRQKNVGVEDMLPQIRVFAFYLLDIAHQAILRQGQSKCENLIRLLRIALRAGRMCIEHGQLDLCTRLFERAAAYVESQDRERRPPAKRKGEDGAVLDEILEELTSEYYLLRAALSWKLDRVDATEYWLSKTFIRGELRDSASLIEKQADLLYEMGKTALKRKQYDNAVRWLNRSCDAIDTLDQEALSPDFCELRFAARSDLIRGLIGLKDLESLSKASNLVALLQTENLEFRLSTCLLQLNLVCAQQPVDVEQFSSILIRIIRSVHLTESNFQTIMHQTHRLKKLNEIDGQPGSQSVVLACQALDSLLPRIFEAENQQWLEKVTVTRIWMVVFDNSAQHAPKMLQHLFDEILNATGKPFSPEATHAAQSLLWKRIDTRLGMQQEADPEAWCRLGFHDIFQQAGDLNKSKLGRKMIIHAISRGDISAAKEAYFRMPETGRAAAITQYLMYKIALRCSDAELASESLEGVLNSIQGDATYLYACALEAQQHGNRVQAISVLQKVLDHYKYSPPKDIYLPALLRSTAKMIMVEMENNNISTNTALLEVCKIFEGAMAQAKSFRGTEVSSEQYQAELNWFASYSYNLALSYISEIEPELLVRFMTTCVAFVDLLRGESDTDKPELIERSLLCHFLAASALVVLGRNDDNVERSLAFYLDTRRQIGAFQHALKEAEEDKKMNSDSLVDLLQKDFELLKYDLEALLKLQQWHDLDRVLTLCLAQKHFDHWGAITDLIIHIHTQMINEDLDAHYQAKVPLVMEKIINASWNHDRQDVGKLARWIRCLFQMTLSINPAMALHCLENAKDMATRANAVQSNSQYPQDELAWLATSAFNHSVDLYCAHDKDGSRMWAEKALNLAMVPAASGDSGLHATLQAKWLRMQTLPDE